MMFLSMVWALFLPGDPVPSSEMEDYPGYINGKPSRHRALVLRQNKIKTRHYALEINVFRVWG